MEKRGSPRVWTLLDEGHLVTLVAATQQGSWHPGLRNTWVHLRGLAQRSHHDEETKAAEQQSNVTKVTQPVRGGRRAAPEPLFCPPSTLLVTVDLEHVPAEPQGPWQLQTSPEGLQGTVLGLHRALVALVTLVS